MDWVNKGERTDLRAILILESTEIGRQLCCSWSLEGGWRRQLKEKKMLIMNPKFLISETLWPRSATITEVRAGPTAPPGVYNTQCMGLGLNRNQGQLANNISNSS